MKLGTLGALTIMSVASAFAIDSAQKDTRIAALSCQAIANGEDPCRLVEQPLVPRPDGNGYEAYEPGTMDRDAIVTSCRAYVDGIFAKSNSQRTRPPAAVMIHPGQ